MATVHPFPNLQVLVWNAPADFDLVQGLLTHGLVSLAITLEGDVNSQHPFLGRFDSFCPNIKALKWDFGSQSNTLISNAVDAVSCSMLRLGGIESLEFFEPLDSLKGDRLKDIILSPDFKVLGIFLDYMFEPLEIDLTSGDTPFPNVETMKVEVWDLCLLTKLLRPHEQRFRNIELKLHPEGYRPFVNPIFSFFTALDTPQRINSLQSIILSLHHDCFYERLQKVSELEDPSANFCLSYETLAPLASFRRLRQLSITLNNQISIDDIELGSLVRNWSSLEVLWLDCRSGRWPLAGAKYVTLRGLLTLIEACPRLWRICLPIDAEIVPMDASPDIRNTAIKTIRLPDSVIKNPWLVAEFFQKHLPSLVDVFDSARYGLWKGNEADLEEWRRMWDIVDNELYRGHCYSMYATDEF